MREITSINPFRLTMCVLNDYNESPQRNNKRLAISSEQQMFASLQLYIDGCLRRATLGKPCLGEAGVLGNAAVLSHLDAIVSRRCVELPVRCLALLRALALQAPGLSVDSERCMMFEITLWAISQRQFYVVPRVGCSVVIVPETVARIMRSNTSVDFFKSVIYSGNTRMGDARQGKA